MSSVKNNFIVLVSRPYQLISSQRDVKEGHEKGLRKGTLKRG